LAKAFYVVVKMQNLVNRRTDKEIVYFSILLSHIWRVIICVLSFLTVQTLLKIILVITFFHEWLWGH